MFEDHRELLKSGLCDAVVIAKDGAPIERPTAPTFGDAGRVAVLSGTGWRTADVKAAWHKGGALAEHTVTFGAHIDQYTLANPTYMATSPLANALRALSKLPFQVYSSFDGSANCV